MTQLGQLDPTDIHNLTSLPPHAYINTQIDPTHTENLTSASFTCLDRTWTT